MRGIKNNESHKVITDGDILISNSSNINNSLKEVIDEQNKEIQELRNNVKWLYKYGGVGGSGDGTSSSKLKANLQITYTDTGGNLQTKVLTWNNSNVENFVIKPSTKVTVTSTLISGITGVEKFLLRNSSGDQISSLSFPDSRTASITFTPGENQQYTVQLNHSSTWSTSFKLYTKVSSQSLSIDTANTSTAAGNPVYDSDSYKLVYTLINYFPSQFDTQSVKSVTINNQSIDFKENDVTIETDSVAGTKTMTLNLDITSDISNYGIYNIEVTSQFGDATLTSKGTWVRKNDDLYVYAYLSSGRSLFDKSQTSPTYYSDRSDIIKFKIYREKGTDPGNTYSITLKYGNNSTTFSNVSERSEESSYTIYNDKESDSEISITFEWIQSNTKKTQTYYLYWGTPEPVHYFFQNDKKENYYSTISDIYNGGDNYDSNIFEKNPLTNISGQLIGTNSPVSFKAINDLKGYVANNSESALSKISECVKTETKTTLNSYSYDFIISLGIKFYDFSISNTILQLNLANNKIIKLTKNLLSLYSNSTTSQASSSISFCIPKDEDYHLVQLYFKSNYSMNLESKSSSAVCVFIDGIIESKFLQDNTGILPTKGSTLQINKGLWDFKHFGAAIINPYESDDTNFKKYSNTYQKYLRDIDPVIPVNYWQAWKESNNEKISFTIDKSIYDTFSTYSSNDTWLNYITFGTNSKTLEKFIPISDPTSFSKFTNLPIYIITPNAETVNATVDGSTTVQDKGYGSGNEYNLNDFLYNTFTSFNENSYKWKVNCKLQAVENGQIKNVIPDKYSMYIRYQGSSTLLYSCKNFEIGTNTYEESENNYKVYWTPDKNKIEYCEQCFNLKADVVDSSHSNNVIIGDFVNKIMTSPFNTNDKIYRPCLTGFPVLLFAKNSYSKGTTTTTDNDYLFLGIYSFNLARSSVHNLGYSSYSEDKEETDSECANNAKFVVTQDNDTTPKQFAVAEVSGNLGVYDFTQYDLGLVNQTLLDDYFMSNKDGGVDTTITATNTTFQGLFKKLGSFVKSYLLKESNPVFCTLNIGDASKSNQSGYYLDNDGELKQFTNKNVYTAAQLSIADLGNYRKTEEVNGKEYTCMLDPSNQFRRVLNSEKVATSDNYYYLDKVTVPEFSDLTSDSINLESFVQYYVICQAFGMLDSVMKNLTFKGVQDSQGNYTWYLGFYDMDTAFGITNSGSEASFQAFSDWVTDDGTIIQDYTGTASNFEGFDTPSSAAFLYAKYYAILASIEDGITPAQLWSTLRSKDHLLQDAEYFKKNNISNYFGEINPLIWNLNFLYKYFSTSKVSSTTTDSELSRFWGTRTYSRIEYLDKRLSYLDVMFGFKNDKTIGRSEYKITADIPKDNSDITINNTAFESFTKGTYGGNDTQNSFIITAETRTPFILQTKDDINQLLITKDTGETNSHAWSIGSNDTCGFWGSQLAKKITNIGYFLSNANKLNTIKSNYLEEIELNAFPTNVKNLNIELNCKNDCPSVNKITINVTDSHIKSLTIIGGENLKTLDIKNLKCTNLKLENIQETCNCTINNLTISDTLEISSGSYLNLKLTNCTITNLNYNGSGKSIEITNDAKIKTLIVGTKNAYNTSLTKIDLKYCQSLTKCEVYANNCSEFYLNSGCTLSNSEYTNQELKTAIIKLADNCKVKIPDFQKLETIEWDSNNTIIAVDYAFAKNLVLNSIPNKIKISGKYCFYYTSISSIGNTYILDPDCKDFQYCFAFCKNLNASSETIKTLLQGSNEQTLNANFSHLFYFCYNVGTSIDPESDSFDIKSSLNTITAVWRALAKATNLDFVFFGTKINYFTGTFNIKQFNHCINPGVLINDNYIKFYIDIDSINNFSTILISLGAQESGWNWGSAATVQLTGTPIFVDQDFKEKNKLSEIFIKSNITKLYLNIGPGWELDYLPKAPIKEVSFIEQGPMWDNTTSKAILYDTLFSKLLSIPTWYHYNYVKSDGAYTPAKDFSYKKLIYNEESKKPRISLKTQYVILGSPTPCSFFGENSNVSISFADAAEVIEAFDSNDGYFRNLFANIQFTGDNISDLYGTISANSIDLSGMFYNYNEGTNSFNGQYLNVNKLFNNSNKQTCSSCVEAFHGCYLEPFTDELNLKNVSNASGMFYNCNYNYNFEGDVVCSPGGTFKNDFKYGFASYNVDILPKDFFSMFLTSQSVTTTKMFANEQNLTNPLSGKMTSDLVKSMPTISQFANMFYLCKFMWNQEETSTDNTTHRYYLFPSKYIEKFSGYNDHMTQVLFPGNPLETNGNTYCLFEKQPPKNKPLTKFPEIYPEKTGDGYWHNCFPNVSEIPKVYLYQNDQDSLNSTGQDIKNIIQDMFSIFLDIPSTAVNEETGNKQPVMYFSKLENEKNDCKSFFLHGNLANSDTTTPWY